MIIAATTYNTGHHMWWVASRASGIVAMTLLTFTVIVGLMAGGKLLGGVKRDLRKRAGAEQRDLTRIHEFASLAAIVMIVLHGTTLLGDAYLHPSISQIAVPFTISYRPLYTGLGIIAAYISIVLGLSYYLRDKIGQARWRSAHRFTIIAYALCVVHVLGSGTDASQVWIRWPMLASAAFIAVLFGLRMRASGGSKPSAPVARAPRSAAQIS